MKIIKKNSKINKIVILLQLLAMSFLFVILSDKQSIFLIKDFLHSINIDSNLYSLLARGYAGIKLMFDLPSCFGIFFFVLQVICATYTFRCWIINIPKKVLLENEKIESKKETIELVSFTKKYSYLENLRLLN